MIMYACVFLDAKGLCKLMIMYAFVFVYVFSGLGMEKKTASPKKQMKAVLGRKPLRMIKYSDRLKIGNCFK